MELVRAKTHAVIAKEQMMAAILTGLPSGYNADFGETKGPFMEALSITMHTLKALDITLKLIKPNEKNLSKACTPEIYATHFAYKLVGKGLPFRDAYIKIKNNLDKISSPDPVQFLKLSNHSGGTNNLKLNLIQKETDIQNKYWKNVKDEYKKIISFLLS